jgi:hypothetical protein
MKMAILTSRFNPVVASSRSQTQFGNEKTLQRCMANQSSAAILALFFSNLRSLLHVSF